MKKIILAIGLYSGILFGTFGQQPKVVSNPNYKAKELKLEEINLVSGYYQQDGNNSAVTGGIGSEYLYDIANSIDVKFSKIDRYNRLHTLNADVSVDYYSSASSDKIDPLTVSSASTSDTHFYPTISYSIKDDISRITKGLSLSYSTEWDYQSRGINLSISKLSKDLNTEFSLKGGAFFDTWMAILPSELRPANYSSGAEGDQNNLDFKPRNSYNLAFSISQVINPRLQVLLTVEPSYQEGLLSTPYHRVYFTDGNHTVEKLPGQRFKLPVGIRSSYFLGDRIIIKAFYRFYNDTWGMQAHTANLEVPIKITPFFSLSPFIRYNDQSAVKYFNPYGNNVSTSAYYTSDYDVSSFSSTFIGSGIRFAPPGGIASKHFNSFEFRYGHYFRTTGMVGNSISMHIKLK